jgi:hypothetical protein
MYSIQTLKYEHREGDIKILARALDLLGKKDIPAAIEVLMAYRNNLIESQVPTLKQYDPREDHP